MVLLILLIDPHHAEHTHLVLSETHHLQREEAGAVGKVQHQGLHCLKPLGAGSDWLHVTVEHLGVRLERNAIGGQDLLSYDLRWTLVEDLSCIPAGHDLLVLAHVSGVAQRVGHLLHSLHQVAVGARVRLGAVLQHHAGGEDDTAALL